MLPIVYNGSEVGKVTDVFYLRSGIQIGAKITDATVISKIKDGSVCGMSFNSVYTPEPYTYKRVTWLTPVWYRLYKIFHKPAQYFRNKWGQF